MGYFKILNLEKEPFSNSPDPGLFYNSKQHLEALQKLEISIRLKRGLSVVTGDVGTGKTTLSRQLIQNISHDPALESFLILDPGFSSTKDFLYCIVNHFTGRTLPGTDETTLKEQIKKHLFSKGVDHHITTVLMIDEGQKLPVFCLEVLRELLNYETNHHKLLQIIIFAQKEFNEILKTLDNFNDRINFRYALSPLGFFETKELIKFRLEKSSAHTAATPFFTFFAYVAIYYYTRGFPRKIINLCHHILLGVIIKNRTRADYFFVASCAKEAFLSPQPRKMRFVSSAILFLILIGGGAVLFNAYPPISDFFSRGGKTAEMPAPAVSEASVTVNIPAHVEIISPVPPAEIAERVQQVEPVEPAGTPLPDETARPEFFGTIRVPKDATLFSMVEAVYGFYKKEYVTQLLRANQKIKNPDHIKAGMWIDFPIIPRTDGFWENDPVCIRLSMETEFEKAFISVWNYRRMGLDAVILPGWDSQKGFLFSIVVNKVFNTLFDADAYKEKQIEIKEASCQKVSSCNDGRKIL